MVDADIQSIRTYLLELQDTFCNAFENEDGAAQFQQDTWERPQGGGGNTRILTNGKLIEQAGVNFSYIYGDHLPVTATVQRPTLTGCSFQALGLSSVIHPYNPYVPTAHFNVRFFIAKKANAKPIWWFGGGFDLTPYYGFTEDCRHFHQTAKAACEPFGQAVYPQFKQQADHYFYLKHRMEPRGIGGLFFDDLNTWGFEPCFAFIRSVGQHFLPAYQPIMAQRKQHSYGQHERAFQSYRRGRYVEFNLVYDRGTLFGLQSGGRTESILMSLPPQVTWRYHWHPEPGTAEARLYDYFLVPRDWADS